MLANRKHINNHQQEPEYYQEYYQKDKTVQVNRDYLLTLFINDKFWFEKYIVKKIITIKNK